MRRDAVGPANRNIWLASGGPVLPLRREGNMVPSHVFPDVVAGDALFVHFHLYASCGEVRSLDKSFQRFVP